MEKRQCKNCSKTFRIDDDDFAFYKKIDVPAPTRCSDCRLQRRMAWRNERHLHIRQCDLCKKTIIAAYTSRVPFPVYCQNCWWSDNWDPQVYAREYNSNKSFFEQFKLLLQSVPRIGSTVKESENSEYTNLALRVKDCYLCFSAYQSEHCLYSTRVFNSRSCIDCSMIDNCELCYGCVNCEQCYQSFFCSFSKNLTNCWFMLDSRGCSDCFGCTGLINKQYYFFNTQYSKAEYEKNVALYIQRLRQDFDATYAECLKQTLAFPRRPVRTIGCDELSTGDNVTRLDHSYHCFDSAALRNCQYIFLGSDSVDCYDGIGLDVHTELSYECVSTEANYHSRFFNVSWRINESCYTDYCFQGEQLFGCIGLRNKKQCILNKPYSATDYNTLTQRIIMQMKLAGEWGEFFPIALSPFPYNNTLAQDYFPLQEDNARKHGYAWYAQTTSAEQTGNTTGILACTRCDKQFRMIPQEESFYATHGVPTPRTCPACRALQRLQLRNPLQLWHRQCMCTQVDHDHTGRCAVEFETTYSPDRLEIVYCEPCYQKEIY